MQLFRSHTFVVLASLAYILVSCYLVWIDQEYLALAPVGLLAMYAAIVYTQWTYLALALFTPLSVNIEEYTESFGLFIPTEPILFGLLILLVLRQIQDRAFEKEIWRHPIIWAVSFYLMWTFITSITSEHPLTSFKFLLAKLWFVIPILFYGPSVFKHTKYIKTFVWLLTIGMTVAISYTLIVHASYGFGEKEGHWVMWPFFKDHTIYGAAVAFVTPLIFGLYFMKKHNPLMQVTIIGLALIILVGLYFSYTRAAWLSVVAALCVLAAIKLKIKFSWIATGVVVLGTFLYFSKDAIQMELERNKYEHTTEEFGERLQSAANVTTDASNLERLNRWSCAIEMFKERPVFGFGPGTYAFEYARFQDPENLTIISTNFGDLGNAHSEYLGPLSEMGLLGLVAMILIVIAIFYKGITLYLKWPSEDREMRTLILSMILALVTYFVHGVLNNFLDTDKAAIPVWGFCAAFIALEIVLKRRGSAEVLD
ncbi:MAG: O-antigen ligase family protein [Flavobacteriales bacterium]|nr:O-antigen ligase family protein [Flavobacteriales bacterium]